MRHIRITVPVWLYGLLPAACCTLKGLSDRLYTDIDSYLISLTCAGLYSNDTFCPDIHPVLSLLVGALSRVWPYADWFSVLGQAFVVLGIWWLGTLFTLCIPQQSKRLTFLLILSFALLQFSLFNINFTVYAGFFSFIGVASLLLSLRTPLPTITPYFGAIFLSLAILWRLEGAALAIPFLFIGLASAIILRQLSVNFVLKKLLPCILSVTLLGISSFGFYAAPERNTARTYNEARGALVDYPHRQWEEIDEQLYSLDLCISENDYNALTAGILLDTNFITDDTLQEVASIAKVSNHDFSLSTIADILCSLPGVFCTPLLRILTAFAGVLLFLLLVSRTSIADKIIALLSLCGSGIICTYYQYIGRLPERVAACVVFALLAVLLPLFLSSPARQSKPACWFWRIICAATCCALCLCLWKNRYNYHILQPALVAGSTEDRTAATDALDDKANDTVYLWNSTTLALYMTDHYLSQGKLPGQTFVQHNLPWGEWNTSGQITYQQLLDELDMQNPMQNLLDRPHTYLVGKEEDITLIQTWLREHYDASATAEQIDTIAVFALGEIPIWQVVSK